MKTKNVLLGIAALLCAFGSAMAALNLTPPHYINVRYQNEPNFTCTTVDACDDIVGTPCTVTVQGFTAPVYEDKLNQTTCSNQTFDTFGGDAVTKSKTIVAVR